MVFSSLIFLFVFLPLAIYAFFLSKGKLRYAILALFSLFFYFWGEQLQIWIIIAVTLINYFAALLINFIDAKNGKNWLRKTVFVTSLAGSFSFLAYFKYFNFIASNALSFLRYIGIDGLSSEQLPQIALPLGISFFTFQAVSYTIDVYQKSIRSNRSFSEFLCYVTMFPQLVAGPIVRYRDIKDQFDAHRVTSQEFFEGIKRFCFGLAKKVLIANTVAGVADQVFALPVNSLNFTISWLGILCYTLQIYFDFSGYSDMAIGLGRMFGFRYLENFNFPYIATSIKDFWRRWHISLSTFFRDYVYIPLGGSKTTKWRTYLNLFIVFFACGLWHGASWTFIVWGLFHGGMLTIERLGLGSLLVRLWRPLQHLYTLFFVMLGWVIFRADSLAYAYRYLKTMLMGNHGIYLPQTTLGSLLTPTVMFYIFIGIFLAVRAYHFMIEFLSKYFKKKFSAFYQSLLNHISLYVSFAQCGCLLVLSVAHIFTDTYNPFIYFRF